jgi:hypothetical protein
MASGRGNFNQLSDGEGQLWENGASSWFLPLTE